MEDKDLSFKKQANPFIKTTRIKVRKGHHLFRFNPKNFETVKCVIDGDFVMEEGYIYISALNEKNVILKYLKHHKKKLGL